MNRLTPRTLVLVAGAGSAALLLGAFGFQFLGGLRPCHLCLLQRWPHGAAVLVAALVLLVPALLRPLATLGALAMLVNTGIALYHTGVERGWWQGPTSCTGSGDVANLSTEQLMAQIMEAPLVRCDEITWTFLRLTMANWNALASLVLAFVWLAAARHAGRPQLSSSASQ